MLPQENFDLDYMRVLLRPSETTITMHATFMATRASVTQTIPYGTFSELISSESAFVLDALQQNISWMLQI